jgi:hypothetical protein
VRIDSLQRRRNQDNRPTEALRAPTFPAGGRDRPAYLFVYGLTREEIAIIEESRQEKAVAREVADESALGE